MNFAQALARIEELNKILKQGISESASLERYDLFYQHANSIVQLAKAAAEMRDDWQKVFDCYAKLGPTPTLGSVKAYDKLMSPQGEKGDDK